MLKKHSSIRAVHPGEILREDILPALELSKTEIAKRLQISRQTLYDLLSEKQGISAEMALKLGYLFGNGAEFWMNLQSRYDLECAQEYLNLSDLEPLIASNA